MSVTSLIDRYGQTVTRRRTTYGKTTLGGVKPAGYDDASIVVYLQVGGGATSSRYGAERARYAATGYCKAGTDVADGDLLIFGTRTYRIEDMRIPDERPTTDALSYVILGLEEDRGAP